MSFPITSPRLECRLLDACIVAYEIKNGAITPGGPYYDAIGIKPGTRPIVFTDGVEAINAGFTVETHDGWIFWFSGALCHPLKEIFGPGLMIG